MRKPGDFRQDCEIKEEALKELQTYCSDIAFVVDDQQHVVDMWRSKGITCLKYAPGYF